MIFLYPSSLLIHFRSADYTEHWGPHTQTIILDSNHPTDNFKLSIDKDAEYVCIFMQLHSSKLLKAVIADASNYTSHQIKDFIGQVYTKDVIHTHEDPNKRLHDSISKGALDYDLIIDLEE